MAMSGDTKQPSIHQLQLFLHLAEELHFGRAARRAFISQPALSRQIFALERNLGVKLIDRGTRTVALAPAGQALLDQIRHVVDAAHELRQQARCAAETGVGRMVIGSFEAIVSIDPIPEVLDELRRRMPGVDIQIRRVAFDAATSLLEGTADATFLPLPVPDGIQYLKLASGPRCAAMCASEPLAQRGRITLADLSDRLHLGWSPRVPKVFQDFWACDPLPDGTPVRYSNHAVADYESALLAIAMGEGIQLPPSVAQVLYPRLGVAYVEVEDVPPWTIALSWLPSKRDHPFVEALRDTTLRVLRKR
ncbi:LysR family transcriptional regulator [Streptomyces acidicola]|uniref:LysR family transcriptional regulator n=1 Tax=Streptomyces acidicola TaxID=2596892 RepID=A0A5N8WJJ2_9ACTN|nr:LysR family transcriptional regulator [Streptomyces acidicola]MPY47633.1 LysR family transcriptional regulator [Streptomyces acidicola]